MQSGYVQCIIHYGDGREVTDITPVTKISMPLRDRGPQGKNIQFLLSASFRNYLLEQDKDFYKVACLESDDLDVLKKRVNQWEALKGYGIREKREIAPDQFWPGFLDYVYSWHRAGNRNLSRGSFSYSPVESTETLAREAPAPETATPDAAQESAEAADRSSVEKAAERSSAEADRIAAREKREAEWRAKVAAHEAAVDEHRRKVAAREAEIARQRAEHSAAQEQAKQALAAHDAKMESFERVLEEQRRRQREYEAALTQNNRCRDGDQKACADIMAGRLDTGEEMLAEETPSTSDDDARTCVTEPVVSASKTWKGALQAVAFNGCKKPVDIRICLLRTGGWNCGMQWGVKPQDRFTHFSFETKGEIFWDARITGTNQPLASPTPIRQP